MRQRLKIPRILKIEAIDGFRIQCMFNNGESRILDFEKIFRQWNIGKQDIEYPLLNLKEFQQVRLRNFTLSWPNIGIKAEDENGNITVHPYEIGADVLFKLSDELPNSTSFQYGKLIRDARRKAGMTQQELALKSGTTRFYISRVENNKSDLELSTFRKIVEAGLGKTLNLSID